METFKKQMEKDGFMMISGNYGTIPAELYNTGKDHFEPRYRSVFIGKCWSSKTGKFKAYYITSSIHGLMRRYHCRTAYDTEIGNIFGSGENKQEAINNFLHNFHTKKYNRRVV